MSMQKGTKVFQHIPKAALNIWASGFSYPTSEDITTASNLNERDKNYIDSRNKIVPFTAPYPFYIV